MLLFQHSRISCLTNTTAASATQDDEIGVVNDETQPCSSKMSGKKEHKDFRDSIDLESGGMYVPYDFYHVLSITMMIPKLGAIIFMHS